MNTSRQQSPRHPFQQFVRGGNYHPGITRFVEGLVLWWHFIEIFWEPGRAVNFSLAKHGAYLLSSWTMGPMLLRKTSLVSSWIRCLRFQYLNGANGRVSALRIPRVATPREAHEKPMAATRSQAQWQLDSLVGEFLDADYHVFRKAGLA